jgi:hypothetical protein
MGHSSMSAVFAVLKSYPLIGAKMQPATVQQNV